MVACVPTTRDRCNLLFVAMWRGCQVDREARPSRGRFVSERAGAVSWTLHFPPERSIRVPSMEDPAFGRYQSRRVMPAYPNTLPLCVCVSVPKSGLHVTLHFVMVETDAHVPSWNYAKLPWNGDVVWCHASARGRWSAREHHKRECRNATSTHPLTHTTYPALTRGRRIF